MRGRRMRGPSRRADPTGCWDEAGRGQARADPDSPPQPIDSSAGSRTFPTRRASRSACLDKEEAEAAADASASAAFRWQELDLLIALADWACMWCVVAMWSRFATTRLEFLSSSAAGRVGAAKVVWCPGVATDAAMEVADRLAVRCVSDCDRPERGTEVIPARQQQQGHAYARQEHCAETRQLPFRQAAFR